MTTLQGNSIRIFHTPNRGLLFGFLAAFFWGTHSVIVRYLTSDIGGMQIAVSRLFIAAAVIYGILRLLGEPISFRWRDWNFRLAVIATVINYILFHIGLEYTAAPNAMVLENIAPFFVLVFLYFFCDTRIGKKEVLATAFVIFGVALTVIRDFEGGEMAFWGDVLEIGAGIIWAVFLIAVSRAMRSSNSTPERLNYLFGILICSGVILSPFLVIGASVPSMNDMVFLLLLGIFPTALAYYFWYEAASQVSTVTATLMFALSVVFTFMNSAIFLNDPITIEGIIGALFVISAVVISTQSDEEKEASK